jgi:LysR family transcriptional regulator, mexEF-oprN operon transcriptional activator
MPADYGRNLDLNLLRVFAVVAETGSVTGAASRLYLTQPAISAALRRLQTTVGSSLFVRQGRGVVLTSRGERLRASIHPHLETLVEAALAPPRFEPATTTRTVRLGLSDSAEVWLLPPLLRMLEATAPGMRIVALPVQFRTVADVLAGTGGVAPVDAAVTVADDLASSIRRQKLFSGNFVCLIDPRHLKIKKLTQHVYFAHEHVIVSYNGDLRGIVEDMLGRQRRVRCSVPSFANLGALVDGSRLIATIPAIVATQIRAVRPHLRILPKPFQLSGAAVELLWPATTDDDPACRFVRDQIVKIASTVAT